MQCSERRASAASLTSIVSCRCMKMNYQLGLLFLAGTGVWLYRALRPAARAKMRWDGPVSGPYLSGFAALLWAASWLLISIYFFFLDDSEHFVVTASVWVVILALLATAVVHDFRRARRRTADTNG